MVVAVTIPVVLILPSENIVAATPAVGPIFIPLLAVITPTESIFVTSS